MYKFIGIIVMMLFFSSCAHHRDVRPGDRGVHKVVVQAADTKAGSRDAINQANHFCEEHEKYAVFLKEKKKYTGDIDEKTYKSGKRISRVAQVVGGAANVMSSREDGSNLGSLLGVGGVAVDSALGEGYTVEMKFKCK